MKFFALIILSSKIIQLSINNSIFVFFNSISVEVERL